MRAFRPAFGIHLRNRVHQRDTGPKGHCLCDLNAALKGRSSTGLSLWHEIIDVSGSFDFVQIDGTAEAVPFHEKLFHENLQTLKP